MKESWLKKWKCNEDGAGGEQLAVWEWLDCNNLGSHASSSWLYTHSRKYHGLLVAALPNHDDRWMMFNSLEESVVPAHGEEIFLNGHYYPNNDQNGLPPSCLMSVTMQPDGHLCWCYAGKGEERGGGWQITREIMLMRSQNSVMIRYIVHNQQDGPLRLKLRPLLAIRNFHRLQRAGDDAAYKVTELSAAEGDAQAALAFGTAFQLSASHRHDLAFSANYDGGKDDDDDKGDGGDAMPILYLQSSRPATRHLQNLWYYHIQYPRERERGYDYQEDLFCPEYWEYCLEPGRHELLVVGGTEALSRAQLSAPAQFWQQELAERLVNRWVTAKTPDFISILRAGADKFIVRQQEVANKIIAGYPWFLSWGRDTMIALPGLTIYNGQQLAAASAILSYYARWLRGGLLPNYLGASAERHAYNSADAGLWWVWAVHHYWLATAQNSEQVVSLWGGALLSIWRSYTAGTHYNIKVNEATGLLYVGSAAWNLTWMDAEVAGKPVTPRYGYAIELNALWYHLLQFLEQLAPQLLAQQLLAQEEMMVLSQQLQRFKAAFLAHFWYADGGYLYDYINEHERNHQLRPNQLWAIALAKDLFDDAAKSGNKFSDEVGARSGGFNGMAESVLEAVDRQLFTPYGLRTLAPQDSRYCGRCCGPQAQRDVAYHNGTVWPWLLGSFFEAAAKCWDRVRVMARWQICQKALDTHLMNDGCIGGIAEIFDGDAPHAAGGTVDQAWSVSELLRTHHLLQALSGDEDGDNASANTN